MSDSELKEGHDTAADQASELKEADETADHASQSVGESAGVAVLSAEVRVLQVGNLQLTRSMYRQLDEHKEMAGMLAAQAKYDELKALLRPTTMASYGHYNTDDIAPSALGRMKLTDIRRFHISEFISDQTKAGRGAETVRKLATLLGTIFASALKDELISANPARGVEKPKQDRDGVEPWEPDEVRIFLGRCAQHRLGALFEVAVLTGLRRGEITGLRWSDVDLVARKIVVRRNRVTVNGRVQEQKNPKTKAGLRTVAL